MREFRTNWDKPKPDSERFRILRVDGDDGMRRFFIEGDARDETQAGYSQRVDRGWAENEVGQGRARYVDSVSQP